MVDLEGTTVKWLNFKTFEERERRTISFEKIEIINPGEGDSVATELDVRGSVLSVFLFEGSKTFTTGRAAYVVEFDVLGRPSGPALYSVEFIPDLNTLRIPDSNLIFTENRVDISVSGIEFDQGAGFAVQLGFSIPGTAQADVLFGDDGNDRVVGNGGNDVIRGGYGKDILVGGAGNDEIDGDGQNDQIRGGRGNDTLNGGKGDDRMFGNSGADTFVIDAGNGKDNIRDFNFEADSLIIRTGADSLDDMSVTFKRGAVILRDEGSAVILNGLTLTELGEADISFM